MPNVSGGPIGTAYARAVGALAKWQRNDLFEAVAEGGLDPQECTFQADDTEAVITHPASRARFVVAQSSGHYRTSSLVGDGSDWSLDRYTWATVPEAVKRWAGEVKRDAETPDRWAELQRQRELFSGAWTAGIQNTPFTPDERTAIVEQVRQVKELISETYALSEAQMESLEERLDYVAEASGRMGRKDWALLVGGVMLAWLLESLVPPDTVQHIFSTLSEGVRHLVEGGWDGLGQLPRGP
jgi:hypothetical protein